MNGNRGNKVKAGIKPLMEWSRKSRKAEAKTKRSTQNALMLKEQLEGDVHPAEIDLIEHEAAESPDVVREQIRRYDEERRLEEDAYWDAVEAEERRC